MIRPKPKKRPDPYSAQGETAQEGEFAEGRSQDPPQRKFAKRKKLKAQLKPQYGDPWDG